jgi:hypothetical protein
MRWLVGVMAAVGCGGASPTSSTTTTSFTSSDLRPSKDGGPSLIAPSRLEALRIAGDKTILPDDMRSRRGTFKFCLDVTGKVGDIEPLQPTGDARYDAKIERAMQQWAYRPVIVDGQPAAICSAVTFIYNRR